MPETAVAEPTTPPSSFLNSPEFNDELNAAFGIKPTAAPEAKPADAAPPPADLKPETAKPADAKPAEAAKPDDDEVPQDIKSENAKSSWKKLKESKKMVETERDTLRGELGSLKSELEKLREAAKTPAQKADLAADPEYQAIKKLAEAKDAELKELSERLQLVNVEKHPKFEAYFNGKIAQQMEIAKRVGGDAAVEALNLPAGKYRDERLAELSLELNPIQLAQLGGVLNQLEAINAEKSAEINSAKERYSQLQAEQKLAEQRTREGTERAFKSVTEDVSKTMAVFQEREGDAEWNKGVRERLSLAEHIFGGEMKPDERAKAAYWSAAAPVILQTLNAERTASAEKISALEKEIASLRAASPAPGSDSTGSANAPAANESPMDAIMRQVHDILPGARY